MSIYSEIVMSQNTAVIWVGTDVMVNIKSPKQQFSILFLPVTKHAWLLRLSS